MLSVLIETRNHEDALVRTLSSLVSGAVEGIVREVIVCDLGSADQTHRVAEHAGCHFVGEGGFAAGVRQAKAEWLLVLEPGARLTEGWMEPVIRHLGNGSKPARLARSRHAERPFWERLLPRRRPLGGGLVITRRQALSLAARAGSAEGLARLVSATRLAAEIMPAPAKAGR